MSTKKSALGKGLSALLENADTDVTSKTGVTGSTGVVGSVAQIQLDQIEAKFPTIQKSNGIYHYEWLGKLHHLDELSNNLKHEKTILSVKDFKKLFEKHDNPLLKVQFEKQSLHFLLALFDELRNRKLLLPKGNKGHFHPLKAYGVDFENNILIKKSPKTIKFTAKKNAEKWEKHVNKAKSWTGGFKL